VVIGLAGLGQLAREVHLPLLRTFSQVRIEALADPELQAVNRCRALAPDASHYSSLSEMLQQSSVHAVLVASPTAEHGKHACEVLRAGKALYLEKPLASTLEEATLVLQEASVATAPAVMGFNYRFHPLAIRMRSALQKYARPVRSGRSVFSIAPRPLPTWKEQRTSGGGVLLDLGSHHFDLLRFMLNAEVLSVSARIWSERTEDDCCELELVFSNGARVQGMYSFCRVEQDTMELSDGKRQFVLHRYAPLRYPLWPAGEFAGYQWERLHSPWKEVSFRHSLASWIESIRNRSRPAPSLADGLESLRIVAAAERSARTGRPCLLDREKHAAGGND
jgi:predicted dehydrogenase